MNFSLLMYSGIELSSLVSSTIFQIRDVLIYYFKVEANGVMEVDKLCQSAAGDSHLSQPHRWAGPIDTHHCYFY